MAAHERFELIVRGGTLVTGAGQRQADVGIRAGRISAIGELGDADAELDAHGQLVLPGMVDGHVHFREPGLTAKEDWASGSRAAAFGGVTTVLDMPNTDPPTNHVDRARAKLALADGRAWCDFGIFGLIGDNNLEQLGDLAESGLIVGFKAFLGPTTGGLSAPGDEGLRRALSVARSAGLRVAFHAEDAAVIQRAEATLRAAGRHDPLAHLESRPVEAEVAAIERLGRLLDETGAAGHALHLSSADGLAAVERWRERGVDLTCEVSAHHLFLGAPDYGRAGGLIKVNPPVRGEPHAAALLAALADGRIDTVASDHAPHAPRDKAGGDIWQVAAGIAGVETTLPLLLSAVAQGQLTMARLVAVFAEAPARIWRLAGKGALEPGADADLTIVVPGRTGTIRGAALHGRQHITPFEGREVVGAVTATLVRGRLVVLDGALSGGPAEGRRVTLQS